MGVHGTTGRETPDGAVVGLPQYLERVWGSRRLIRAEKERGPHFVRLANALSALYPRGSEEKRLVDAMLLAVPA